MSTNQHTPGPWKANTLPDWPGSFEPQMALLISKAYEAEAAK